MCGIAGIVAFGRGENAPAEGEIAQMLAALAHRGPDGARSWVADAAGLGCTRLAINDLSPAGDQPMHIAGRDLHLVCNGEIYNHENLRRELSAAGARFAGHSDVEIILHGYAHWGSAVFARLVGMFAVALWDGRARELILARDRMGEKPLYYSRGTDRMGFASEIGALIAHEGAGRRVDLDGIDQYLTFGYLYGRRTAFSGIERVLPGEIVSCRADGRVEVRSFRARMHPPPQQPHDPGAALEVVLSQAVAAQTRADVPVGALLSGGVDSSTVAALMARAAGPGIRTFTVGFDIPGFDEREAARAVAAHLKSDHHEHLVADDPRDLVDQVASAFDEPFADPSAAPSLVLSRFAARSLKAVLSGDGADELLLGYTRYRELAATEWVKHIPGGVRRFASRVNDALPPEGRESRWVRIAGRWANRLDARPSRAYAPLVAVMTDMDRRGAYGPALSARVSASPLDQLDPLFGGAGCRAEGASRADLETYLPGDILAKVDTAGMAHGLEIRSPFLDPAVVDLVLAMPVSVRLRHGLSKRPLREVAARLLPPAVLSGPKRGFGAPVDAWFRGPLRDMARDCLLAPRFLDTGLLSRAYVQRLVEDHELGRWNNGRQLWALLMLSRWLEQHLEAGSAR